MKINHIELEIYNSKVVITPQDGKSFLIKIDGIEYSMGAKNMQDIHDMARLIIESTFVEDDNAELSCQAVEGAVNQQQLSSILPMLLTFGRPF